MKHIKFIIILTIIGVVICPKISAACAVGAYVDNELVCLVNGSNSKNSSGTAYEENAMLVLNGYNGGTIEFYSGLGNFNMKIKLVGDNYITNTEGCGIWTLISGISFVGDGTLTINSKLPLAYYDTTIQNKTSVAENIEYDSTNAYVIKIYGSEYNNNQSLDGNNEISTNDDVSNKVNANNDNLLLYCILCSSMIILLISVILLFKVKKIKIVKY